MTTKKKIGIPLGIGLWCISKMTSSILLLSAIALILSVIVLSITYFEEYIKLNIFIKITLGLLVSSLMAGTLFLLLATKNNDYLDDKVTYLAYISVGLLLILMIELLIDKIVLYFKIKRF